MMINVQVLSSADKESRRIRSHNFDMDSDTSTSMTCARRNQAAVSQNVAVTYSANLKATPKEKRLCEFHAQPHPPESACQAPPIRRIFHAEPPGTTM